MEEYTIDLYIEDIRGVFNTAAKVVNNFGGYTKFSIGIRDEYCILYEIIK